MGQKFDIQFRAGQGPDPFHVHADSYDIYFDNEAVIFHDSESGESTYVDLMAILYFRGPRPHDDAEPAPMPAPEPPPEPPPEEPLPPAK